MRWEAALPPEAGTQTLLDVLALDFGHPDAPAILAPGREPLSRAALRAQVDAAGATLAALGYGRGNRIGVAIADGPDAAVAMLTAMIFATCAPLDPRLGATACRQAFEQLRLDALIAAEGDDSPIAAAAAAQRLPVLRLSRGLRDAAGMFVLRGESDRAPVRPVPPQPDDVALLVQTSGTTARPKIVPVTHIQHLWSVGVHSIDSFDRCLGLTPLHTRSGIGQCVIVPIATGASSILTPGFDADRIIEWLDVFRPTYYCASPTIHRAIIDVLAERRPAAPHSLRFVRANGSALPASLQDEIESVLGVPVVQGYGSTEGGLITQNPLPPGRRPRGSVGVVVCAQVAILGESAEHMAAGHVGEIVVRGPGVMQGYENDPEANRLAFHEGWLRTGDLGYRDEDGYFYLIGRVSEIINRGGLKVSPAEVDEVLMRHPAVREAATCGIAHPSLGFDVVSAIVLRVPGAASAEELRDFALRQLVPSKAPSSVVLVDDFPRTALGKVQRQVLAELLAATLRARYVAPRSREETIVADTFASVLELPRVGARDHFFHLGGDSLRATQVLSRLAAQTGVELDQLAVFAAPTVEALARRIITAHENACGEARSARPPLRRRPA